ncbi:acyclic terpene utilization AtuA family protein [Limimaricola cinnabarinus]|uniref:Hypotheical conserved protein n=1 Tax=Limimaricola cinnabarinus LL-001 TaxID=1337093 RepID=U3AKT4_9RHOB|nr:acyclic terpene utilization AtuA family protein [Limimaricola cinnabarinus]GAD55348.1 hypotheical conserved protein [Limimaricola cinnabarinus LL-001]
MSEHELQPYRIGCGAGFAGDRIDAAQAVVAALAEANGPACLIFEMLAERTLALAQLDRAAGRPGYDATILDRLAPVLEICLERGIRIVGNFGAAAPEAAARAILDLAGELGCRMPRIAVVEGDDLMGPEADPGAAALLAACLPDAAAPMSANVYLGAAEIAAALRDGADIVVTGRVADPALALGPLVAHYGWCLDDHDRIAAGTMVGHLLECGAQVSGGYFADPGYKDVPGLHEIGFPIAEVARDGGCVITKPAGSGGLVDTRSVTEQLLYEIHDPAAYLTPDVILDLSDVDLVQEGLDRVRLSGARGHPAPETLKSTVCYAGGHLGEAEISYAGPNAQRRARAALEAVTRRLPEGLDWRGDLIGAISVFGDDDNAHLCAEWEDADDIRLRLAVSAPDRAEVERAMHEFGALYTCGPAGGAGLRVSIRPRVYTGAALIPRRMVRPSWRFVEAAA